MKKPVVLVVESAALVRMSAVDMVENAGFAVVEASNAEEALMLLDTRGDIGALFTNIRMTGSMDGMRLVRAVRDRWPPIHLIVASGVPTDEELPANARFIQKPYRTADVAAVLWDLFGTHPAPHQLMRGADRNYGRMH